MMSFLLIPALLGLPAPPSDDVHSSSPVILNEFMSTPMASSSEAEGEWIEIYNRSDSYVNLCGWRIQNQAGATVTLTTYLLPPGAYYVLGSSSDTARNGGYTPDFVYSGFGMPSAGILSLVNPEGQTVESLSYGAGWPVVPGSSCERINPGWMAGISSSWGQSTTPYGSGDDGTPGAINSVFENSFADNTWAFIKAFVQ